MDAPKNLKDLEAALPSLVEKLKALRANLSPEEALVFSEIIESAALHTEVIESHEEGDPAIRFEKPKSVHSTISMKKEYLRLPDTLGIRQKS